jgi:DNA-binding NarL/FixJ family response regulator
MATNNNHRGVALPTQQTTTTSIDVPSVEDAVLNLLMTGHSVTDICKQLNQFSDSQIK